MIIDKIKLFAGRELESVAAVAVGSGALFGGLTVLLGLGIISSLWSLLFFPLVAAPLIFTKWRKSVLLYKMNRESMREKTKRTMREHLK